MILPKQTFDLNVRFSADYVRFGPESGRIDTVTVESARDPKETFGLRDTPFEQITVSGKPLALVAMIGFHHTLAILRFCDPNRIDSPPRSVPPTCR